MDYNRDKFEQHKQEMLIAQIKNMERFAEFSEFDLQDLLHLMQQPSKALHQCISKGQLKDVCSKLLVENAALRVELANARKEIERANQLLSNK